MTRRRTFWLDDRLVDEVAPAMRRYAAGTAALAVYAVLARRADRDGESWPRLRTIAEQAAMSPRTAQRALHLLEALGLVAVTTCYDAANRRQTSNRYTLLPLPATLPTLDPDPARWPPPQRRILAVPTGGRTQRVADGRRRAAASASRPGPPPRQHDTLPPATVTPSPRQHDTLPPVTVAGHEGEHSRKDHPVKDGSPHHALPETTFVIDEVGLSNRQVWAAVLGELEQRGEIAPADLNTWLRPAALAGRDGATLLLGVGSTTAQARVHQRLLPAVRAAVGQVVGAPLPVAVVVQP